MAYLNTACDFIKLHWKYLLGLAVVLAFMAGGYYLGKYIDKEWQEYKNKPATTSTNTVVTLPQQTIQTNTETVREVSVQSPTTEGAVLQFVEKNGKVVAVINGQETEVPNLTGQPNVEIGKNGELSIATSSTTKIDVTDMANAQARLIANQELEKQAKANKEAMDKEKASRNRERLLWGAGTAGLLYLTHK
ncbi:MAG: hypothetical protein ABFD79_13660 [Phycisphaerales bacterium]